MPRQTALAKSPLTGEVVTHLHVSAMVITDWPYFQKLNATQQKALEAETKELNKMRAIEGRSKLYQGRHLAAINKMLAPMGLWNKFLKKIHYSAMTAHRYIEEWKLAKANLSQPLIDVAMQRNINIMGSKRQLFGKYTKAAKALPPPKNPTTEEAHEYFNQLEERYKEFRRKNKAQPDPPDPQVAAEEVFRVFSNRYEQIELSGRRKADWVRQVVGMIMAKSGYGNQTTFEPVAIPQDFARQRGRPPLEEEKDKAA